MGDPCHRIGLVRHESYVNGYVPVFCKKAEGQRQVILAAVDDASLVDDDILAAMGFQKLRQ